MTAAGTSVLVVEDEESIVGLVRLYVEREGWRAQSCSTGEEALAAVHDFRPDAIVLDIRLPGMDGLEVCRRLRTESDWTPVLFVTARDEEADRIVGLELGADDYIVKPFSPRELIARIKAVLRRGSKPNSEDLVVGAVRVDLAGRHVWVGPDAVELTSTEFDLLTYLMRHAGRVCSRPELLAQVWGYADASSRTVDVHVAQLRSKLGPTSLVVRTVRGVGYAVEAP